jgi:hypothetical protein
MTIQKSACQSAVEHDNTKECVSECASRWLERETSSGAAGEASGRDTG